MKHVCDKRSLTINKLYARTKIKKKKTNKNKRRKENKLSQCERQNNKIKTNSN